MAPRKLLLVLFVALLIPAGLLVAGIVGGAFFATVQDTCNRTVAGFTNSAVRIGQFDATDGKLEMELRNAASEEIRVREIRFSSDGSKVASKSINETLILGDSIIVSVTGFQESDSCNSYDVTAVFDRNQIEGNIVEGSIRGEFSVS